MRSPKRNAALGLCLLAVAASGFASGASAQSAASRSEQELTGMRLFNQHCRVCHTKPLLTSGQYGPVLSKNSLGGDAVGLHDFIANGTPRMPGFKYDFAPAQIDAIVAYLKTMPAPTASAQ